MECDVLLHFAMDSEFEDFEKKNFFHLRKKELLADHFGQYSFKFRDKNATSRNGIVVVTNEIGRSSKDTMGAALAKYSPDIIINIGISGLLDKDISINDTVVADSIEIYDHRGAIKNLEAGGLEIVFGGKFSPVDTALVNQFIDVFRTNSSVELDLFDFCDKHYDIETERLEKFLKGKSVSVSPELHKGPTAQGVSVIKSAAYKTLLLEQKNKNFMAVDMESGDVGVTVNTIGVDNPRYLSIRAISDPGDETKADYDAIGPNLFRDYSVYIASSRVSQFLRGFADFKDNSSARSESFDRQQLIEISDLNWTGAYPAQYLQSDKDNIEQVSKRYPNFSNRDDAELTSFDNLNLAIQHLVGETDGHMLIEGSSGSGKSALLRFLYSERRELKEENISAVYFCSHFLKSQNKNLDSPRDDLTKYFNSLMSYAASQKRRLDVFLDNIDGDSFSEIVFLAITSNIASFPNVRLTVCRTLSNIRYRDSAKFLDHFQWSHEFQIKDVMVSNDSRFERFAASFLETSGAKENLEYTVNRLRELGTIYCNHYLISLVVHNSNKRVYRESRNYVELIFQSLKEVSQNYAQSVEEEHVKEFLALMGIEALKRYSDQNLVFDGDEQNTKRFTELYDDHFRKYPRIAQKVMIGYGIVWVLRKGFDSIEETLNSHGLISTYFDDIVFDNETNFAIKTLTVAENVESHMVDGAIHLLSRRNGKAVSFGSYLLGRLSQGKQVSDSIELLKSQKDIEGIGSSKSDEVSDMGTEERLARMARRSRLISLASLGEGKAAEQYVDLIITENVENSLNRGFHLEYYLDRPNKTLGIELALEDENRLDWSKSREALNKRIFVAIEKGRLEPINQIELATYLSFYIARHEEGRLSNTEIDEVISLLESLSKVSIGSDLLYKLVAAQKINFRHFPDRFDKIQHVINVYNLKHELRAGWESRNMRKEGKTAKVIEAVGSHVFGTQAVAWFLLPNDLEEDAEGLLDKSTILKMLFVHDLAESFYGDYRPDKSVNEEKYYNYLEGIRICKGINSIDETLETYRDFNSRKDINSLIAKDIDKLDAMIQAGIYKEDFPDSTKNGFREFIEDHRPRLRTKWANDLADDLSDFFGSLNNQYLRSVTPFKQE